MRYEQALIRSNTRLGPGHYLLELALPGLGGMDLSPGRFINLRCTEEGVHDLMRPFSILGATPDNSALLVYAKALGRLSALLGDVPVGAKLDCLYPLGSKFPTDPAWRKIALVGGGVGLAPLLYLGKQLLEQEDPPQVTAFFGGGTESDLVPALLEQYNLACELATMDGSRGFHGTVIDLYRTADSRFDAVYTCGPNAMMAALQAAVPPEVAAYASLEEYMACGVGACLGCVAAVERGGKTEHLTVCKSGPVFSLHEVRFQP